MQNFKKFLKVPKSGFTNNDQNNVTQTEDLYLLRKEYVMSMKVSSIGRFYVPSLALFLSLKVKGDTFLKFLDRITQIEGLNFKKMP